MEWGLTKHFLFPAWSQYFHWNTGMWAVTRGTAKWQIDQLSPYFLGVSSAASSFLVQSTSTWRAGEWVEYVGEMFVRKTGPLFPKSCAWYTVKLLSQWPEHATKDRCGEGVVNQSLSVFVLPGIHSGC